MKFREFIRESKEKHAVLAFGRMNPPTTGHEVLVNKVKEVAQQHNASHHVVLSHSQDKAKNPLSASQKALHARRFFPGTNISVATKEHPNFLSQAQKLHQKGVTHLHMVAGSDRVDEYHKILHKYNGTHEGALFNFKSIKVHNAGERDPDAEGASGMSASKMRGHASASNFKDFKKGIPGHVPEHHARELYDHVRKGMGIRENLEVELPLDDLLEQVLFEGVHDKGIFKAVFLAGGPGSGKDYVLDNTLAGHGLTEINSDKALEFLMDKEGLDKTMPAGEQEKRDIIRGKAKNVTELRQRLALLGRNGLIINGTGDDHEKIAKIKKRLEEIGYDTHMVVVNTADEVSAQRNVERGQRGGRTVPEEIRKKKWDAVQNARPELAKMFGDNYVEFDNSEDLRQADPDTVKSKKDEMLGIFKKVKEFVSAPPKSEESQLWIASEMSKKDTLKVPQKGAEKIPHPDSGAAEEAKKLGLSYFGFGRWGKGGVVTHHSVHDSLVPIEREKVGQKSMKIAAPGQSKTASSGITKAQMNPTKVNEEFEEFLSESIEDTNFGISESKKEPMLSDKNLMKDKNGKVRVFMLRRAAAKEAHTNGGVVYKSGKGYVIKIKESEDVSSINQPIQEQKTGTRSTIQIGSTGSTGSLNTESRETCGSSCACDTCSGTEEKTTKKKSVSEAKKQWQAKKTTSEAIDANTEVGMSLNGYSKEKLDKNGKVTMTELTGDETTMSIGDQKEDELKKKGINLSSFKSKKAI